MDAGVEQINPLVLMEMEKHIGAPSMGTLLQEREEKTTISSKEASSLHCLATRGETHDYAESSELSPQTNNNINIQHKASRKARPQEPRLKGPMWPWLPVIRFTLLLTPHWNTAQAAYRSMQSCVGPTVRALMLRRIMEQRGLSNIQPSPMSFQQIMNKHKP